MAEVFGGKKRGLVESLFVATKMVDFVPEGGGGKSVVKVGGLIFRDELFESPNRGQWDLSDTRTRLPWEGVGILVDPEAHDEVRYQWKRLMESVVQGGRFPVWVIRYAVTTGAKDTFRGLLKEVEVASDLYLEFFGAALEGTVFRPAPPAKGKGSS